MFDFEPLLTEPRLSHYSVSGLRAWLRPLRARLRGVGSRLRFTLWRIGTHV